MRKVQCKKCLLAAFCLFSGGAFTVSALHSPREEQPPANAKVRPEPFEQRNLARNISWLADSPPPVRFSQNSPTGSRGDFKPPGFILQLSVHPQRSSSVASQIILAGGANIPACKAYIELRIHGAYDKDEYRILFRAEHADGSPAGRINGPGKEDDLVHWDALTAPYVPFRSDSKTGKVQIWAEVINANGEVVVVSNRHELQSILPELRLTYGLWQPSSKAGTWERRIYVTAETKALGFLDLAGLPVQLKLAPVTSAGTIPQASSFAKASGATVGEWISSATLKTDDMPYTGIQYWKETPTGTRQLNTYRVKAVIDKAQLLIANKEATP